VDLEAAKALFVEYAQSRGFSLGYQDFEAEMADFPGKYGRHRLRGARSVSDRYFDDFKIGERFETAGMTLTEAGIIEFARQWDPQPFHIDVEFSRSWTYGGLIASGLHTMCASLRLWLELGVFKHCSLGSPGLGETKFPHPVRPGDTIRVIVDITDLRLSASKPDRGLGRIRQVTVNQRGEPVMEQETMVFLKRRPAP
jgi:acyl dehydratase